MKLATCYDRFTLRKINSLDLISGLLQKHVPFRSYNYNYYRRLVPETQPAAPAPEPVAQTKKAEPLVEDPDLPKAKKTEQKNVKTTQKAGKGSKDSKPSNTSAKQTRKDKPVKKDT